MHVPCFGILNEQQEEVSGKVSIAGIQAFSVRVLVPAQDAHVPVLSHLTALCLSSSCVKVSNLGGVQHEGVRFFSLKKSKIYQMQSVLNNLN